EEGAGGGAEGGVGVGGRREDGHVILSVTDSGSGIPAADLGRIFLRLARADLNGTGVAGDFGFGLAVVQAIAEAHHGSARASSTLGQGSVFEVLLPAIPEPPSPEAPAPPRPMTAGPSSPPDAKPVADLGTVSPAERTGTPGPSGPDLRT